MSVVVGLRLVTEMVVGTVVGRQLVLRRRRLLHVLVGVLVLVLVSVRMAVDGLAVPVFVRMLVRVWVAVSGFLRLCHGPIAPFQIIRLGPRLPPLL